MTLVRQGRLEALGTLFERHSAPLLNFFHRLTGDREASRDLVQTLFERILRYRQSYREDARFRPWIYQMARNVVADHWRRTSRLKIADDVGAPDGADTSPADRMEMTPDPSWVSRRDARDLQEALDQLSPADRELLVLSRFHGLRYEEIATIMQKSVAAVKVQAHRAMHALRRIYFESEATHEA